MFNFWTCSMCFCRSSYFWARAAADGVLSWSMLGSWEFQYRRRGCFEFEVSSSSLLQELAEKRRSLEDLSVFDFWPSIGIRLMSYCSLCVLSFFLLPLGVGFCKGFSWHGKEAESQVFNTHYVKFFSPSFFVFYFCTFVLHPGSWGGSFPLGPCLPGSDWRVNKRWEVVLVFACDKVTAEMHISLAEAPPNRKYKDFRGDRKA